MSDSIQHEQAALKARIAQRGWATFDEATQFMRLQRRQQLADEQAERWSEARRSRHVAAFEAMRVDAE